MNKNICCLILFLIQLSFNEIAAQEYFNVPLSSAKYFDNHITTSATMDSTGNLWVGTVKGLYRFDGGQSINASNLLKNWDVLQNAFISEIHYDSKNRLWINTKTQGIAIVDLDDMYCSRVSVRNKEGEQMFDYSIHSLEIDNDIAWASLWNSREVSGGILSINMDDASTSVTPLENIIVPGIIHKDLQDERVLWLTGESLVKFDKISKTYREIEYDSTINAEHLISITENANGNIFIAYRDSENANRTNKILRYNKDKENFSDDSVVANLPFSINSFSMYNDSLLLMTSSDDPYYQLYNTYSNTLVDWDLKNDLIRSSGKIVHLGEKGLAILGSNLNYLKKVKQAYSLISLKQNEDEKDAYYGNGHFTSEGYIYPQLGSRDYLYVLDTFDFTIRKLDLDQKYNYRALYDLGNNNSLAVARDAIALVNRSTGEVNTLKEISDYIPDESSTRLFFNSSSDENGNVWIATSHNSLLKFDVRDKALVDYKMPSWDKSSPTFIFDVAADAKGNIIAAGRYELFYKGKNDSTFVALNERFNNLELPENIIPYSVSVVKDREFLLGTWANGIYKINLDREEVARVGPDINNVYIESIRSLGNNKFAFIAGDYLAFYDSSNDHYKILKEKHGIDLLPFRNPIAIRVQSKYAISFDGTLRLFDVNNLLQGEDKKINIARIAVNGTPYAIDEELDLNYDQNNIEINYALSENDIYNQVKYRYSLSSDEPNWVEVDSKKDLMFTNLKPAHYTLSIQSTSIDGFWIDNQVDVRIDINPPWYKTWLAKLIFGLALLGILFLLVRFYVNYQKRNLEYEKRFAQLETMILKSQMNPHFIFNSLNSIRFLFMKDQKDKGLKYITKFAKLLRSTLHHGDHALVSLSEEIELTELYIELEQLRFEGKFRFESLYDASDKWRDILIPPFVVQPLVENAFWHGLSGSERKDKKLKIEIVKNSAEWLIHVVDNGIGINNIKSTFDVEVGKKKSYGLSILKERFELINGIQNNHYSISFETPSDQIGTKVTIKINEQS